MVIGRDPLDQFYSFTIDVGWKNGAEKGNVVVSEHGYLVGMVLDSTYTSAKVVTILNPALNVACMVSRTRDNGLVTGSDVLASEGLCLMNNPVSYTHLGGLGRRGAQGQKYFVQTTFSAHTYIL